jgi:hypothetical protein
MKILIFKKQTISVHAVYAVQRNSANDSRKISYQPYHSLPDGWKIDIWKPKILYYVMEYGTKPTFENANVNV